MTTRVMDLRRAEGALALRDALGGRALARAEQVHGDLVEPLEGAPGAAVKGADGLATRSKIALLALGADCPGVAVVGAESVAVAHSGWRGTVADIGPAAVERLVAWGEDRSKLQAFVGPGIGLCCFEVGDEVVAAFESAHGPLGALVERRKKAHIDLKGAIAQRLVEKAGLARENVLVAPECTRCSREKFFSYRGEGPSCGHHAVVALLA